MTKYTVTLRATLTTTVEIDAETRHEAVEEANELYICNSHPEWDSYEQEVIFVSGGS